MTLLPRLVHQLTWGRFVNAQGGKGKNIPCDLHNEHVNRVFKEVVANMGSNFTQESSTRVARCVTSLDTLTELFDEQCAVPKESSSHTTKSDNEDVLKVCQEVMKNNIVEKQEENRKHSSHPKISCDPLGSLDRNKMEKWMKEQFEQRRKYRIMSDGFESETDSQSDSDESDIDIVN